MRSNGARNVISKPFLAAGKSGERFGRYWGPCRTFKICCLTNAFTSFDLLCLGHCGFKYGFYVCYHLVVNCLECQAGSMGKGNIEIV